MWNFCDDGGVHKKSYKTLKMEVFPGDNCSEQEIKQWINELISYELLVEYSVNGNDYWQVTGWKKHQRIDKPNYKHPSPQLVDSKFDESSSSGRQLIDENSSNTSLLLSESSSSSNPRIGMEWNLKEEESKYNTSNDNILSIDSNSSSESQGKKLKSYDQPLKPKPLKGRYDVVSKTDPRIVSLFQYWQKVMNHPHAVLDDKRYRSIAAALGLGYSVDQLKQAIDGCAKSPFNMGENKDKKKYDDINLIFRDAEHIEGFIQKEVAIEPINSDSITKLIDNLSVGAI
jgi:hypothetical protein